MATPPGPTAALRPLNGAVGTVAFVGGAGAALGGLAMVAWGGPARQRMRGMLLLSLLFGGFAAVTALQPSLVAVGVGAFGPWRRCPWSTGCT